MPFVMSSQKDQRSCLCGDSSFRIFFRRNSYDWIFVCNIICWFEAIVFINLLSIRKGSNDHTILSEEEVIF